MSGIELSPQARALVEGYLTEVRDALRGTDLPRSEILVDLRTHIEESAAGSDGSVEVVRAIIDGLGPAEQYRETAEETAESPVRSAGRVLGMPYDFGLPTTAKLAARWWNPSDPHILVPRVWGVGWSINFGAIAVKMGIMRPDDEDAIPFGNVPDRTLLLSMLVPTAIAAVGALAAVVAWRHLPAEVPTHWDIAGQPDQWGSKVSAFGFLMLMGAGPVVLGWLLGFRRGTSRAVRAFWVAGTTMLAALGSGLVLMTIFSAAPGGAAWWIWADIVAALGLMFVMLIVMSKAGIRAEWRDAPDTKQG